MDSGPGSRALSRPGLGAPERKARIRERALAIGFDAVGFAAAEIAGTARRNLGEFLAQGFHGDMGWMESRAAERADPGVLWPAAKSVVVLGLNYGPKADPLALTRRALRGAVSVYAQGRDYHDVLRRRLRALAGWMAEDLGCEVKLFVDTAPVMEKHLGEAAGIGWQGKHTNLISRAFGSWLFLGEVYTTLELGADAPGTDHCGACTRCLDVCPTKAFPAPYQLDATRCISYLTIEHKGHIPRALRTPIGNRIYGCDDCLAVCPWNKFARATTTPALMPRIELTAPRLADLAALDEVAFRALFAGTAVRRTGRDRFMRNVLIAIGNSGNEALAEPARRLLDDASPLVRAMAVWALSRLLDAESFRTLRAGHAFGEADPQVREEWEQGAD